jgi:LacI family transcriptional regulator
MRSARSHGLGPGPDLGGVGFADTDVAEALQLTSVRQPLQRAAESAWTLLQAVTEEPPGPVLLTPTLTIRSTTTRARLTNGQHTDHTQLEGTP